MGMLVQLTDRTVQIPQPAVEIAAGRKIRNSSELDPIVTVSIENSILTRMQDDRCQGLFDDRRAGDALAGAHARTVVDGSDDVTAGEVDLAATLYGWTTR